MLTPTEIAQAVYGVLEIQEVPVNLSGVYDLFPSDLTRTDKSVIVHGTDTTYEYEVNSPFEEAQVIGRCFLGLFEAPSLTDEQLRSVEDFALALLIPEEDFRTRALVTGQGDALDVAGLAETYGVPKAAIVARAHGLYLA